MRCGVVKDPSAKYMQSLQCRQVSTKLSPTPELCTLRPCRMIHRVPCAVTQALDQSGHQVVHPPPGWIRQPRRLGSDSDTDTDSDTGTGTGTGTPIVTGSCQSAMLTLQRANAYTKLYHPQDVAGSLAPDGTWSDPLRHSVSTPPVCFPFCLGSGLENTQ